MVVAVICLTNILETKAAPKLGLLSGLELPILGKINTDVNVGVDDQKGLLGLTKFFVKGLKAKATSSILKRIFPKGNEYLLIVTRVFCRLVLIQ